MRPNIDDFDWVRDINPTLNSPEDIEYFLNKPFKIYDRETGELCNWSIGNGISWLEYHEESPEKYNVCWVELGIKRCVTYRTENIVRHFTDSDSPFLWKFV